MEATQLVPKPMVHVGSRPILHHIMACYGTYGFRRFIVCLGYKGHLIEQYFQDVQEQMSDLVVDGGTKSFDHQPTAGARWKVALVDTGEHSLTGTRLVRVTDYLDAPHFCLTYGDGLSNIALDQELAFHLEHGKLGTVAAVHPPSRFGRLYISDDGIVSSFCEKERLHSEYINGGFFIFRREFLSRLDQGQNVSLEVEPLSTLAQDGQLCAFKHEGFWQCMDTMREREYLESLMEGGDAPWVR
jgi:glucose-1-phosphate cytidylyltransferase